MLRQDLKIALQQGLFAAAILASFAASAASAQPPGCTDAVHRAFDFWIGEWEVRAADGTLLGHNTITSFANGCGLLEHWRGAQGGEGKSVNAYDPALERWTQRWVGGGAVLWLTGGLVDGEMVLADDTNRISWSRTADGGVRQVWDVTADGGATWRRVFDGHYRKDDGGTQ